MASAGTPVVVRVCLALGVLIAVLELDAGEGEGTGAAKEGRAPDRKPCANRARSLPLLRGLPAADAGVLGRAGPPGVEVIATEAIPRPCSPLLNLDADRELGSRGVAAHPRLLLPPPPPPLSNCSPLRL